MPKKLFAVTNVKLSTDDYWPAGSEIDATKFTKDQLIELRNAGAVEIRVVEDEVVVSVDNPPTDDSSPPTDDSSPPADDSNSTNIGE